MSYDEDDRRWDLTPVINLIHSLSSLDNESALVPLTSYSGEAGATTFEHLGDEHVSILGNFDNIWTSLGKPLNAPPPIVKWDLTDGEPGGGKTDESDPTEAFSTSKEVRWRDEDGIADLEDNDELDSGRAHTSHDEGGRRRKRPGKRERQVLKGQARSKIGIGTTSSDFESENELQRLRESPTRKGHSRNDGLLSATNAIGGRGVPSTYESSGPSSTSPPKVSILKPPLPWPVSSPVQHVQYPQIEPLVRSSPAERKINLVLKLVKTFPGDGDRLLKLPSVQRMPGSAETVSNGIHVFVDCSNVQILSLLPTFSPSFPRITEAHPTDTRKQIMIGFFETLKRARAIPLSARVRRVPMSFHNLALILERGRPASKRVLVGSMPLIPAVQEAQECGYETSILDRVMKARDINTTPHKKQRKNRTTTGTGTGTGTATSGASSGSESAGPRRLVEQAVDEILHLKLLESVVDSAEPATIVLATGDAAEAEYSGGFLRMVERALEKGWRVELVSFAQNTSFAYRRRAFRERWGARFRVIELDSFREELLDL
ncbi:MAG: hypothetical protein M1837_004869 [Sclerophora amabilis]|nr:MAG: hypothetical protein M1837_004869 [Sclerophora amabilis]